MCNKINLIVTYHKIIHFKFNQKFVSFIWDMTRSNWLDIMIATGGNQTKLHLYILHLGQIWHTWCTQYHACSARLNLSNNFNADNGCGLVSIDRSHARHDLSVSYLKWKKTNFVIKFRIYYFWVEVMHVPWELWSN